MGDYMRVNIDPSVRDNFDKMNGDELSLRVLNINGKKIVILDKKQSLFGRIFKPINQEDQNKNYLERLTNILNSNENFSEIETSLTFLEDSNSDKSIIRQVLEKKKLSSKDAETFEKINDIKVKSLQLPSMDANDEVEEPMGPKVEEPIGPLPISYGEIDKELVGQRFH